MIRKLVVVADDLGACVATNKGVLQAHREGIVTAASLLVGMPSSKAAAEAAAAQGLPLGLHVRLTTGPPLSPGPATIGLARAGRFCALPQVLARLSLGGAELRRVLIEELRAQVQAFEGLVAQADHINSHHHLHLHPAVLEPFLEVASQAGFPALRWPVERGSSGASPVRWAQAQAFALLARRGRVSLASSGLFTSDHFRGLAAMGALNAQALAAILRGLPSGLTELMCHPVAGAVGEPGTQELASLCAVSVRQQLEAESIQLGSFAELC